MKSKFILLLAVLALPILVAGYLLVQRTGGPETTPVPVAAPKPSPVDVAALKAKAEVGDPAAETSLGRLYLEGTAVKADVKEAVKWIQLAADTNYPDALATLGELTQAGQGVPRNLEAAAELYRRAAESGSVAGQYNLGYSYE